MARHSEKTVAAILPNYNYANYITSRINEILEQTYRIAEIIILDDASTDGSVQIIQENITKIKEKYPEIKVKVKINKQNSGNVFSQWQKGIELAEAEYIWIAEMDDSANANFLENVMRGFDDLRVVLSYTNSKLTKDNDQLAIKDSLRQVKDIFRKKHSMSDYVVEGVEELNRNLAVFNSIPNVSAVVFKNQEILENVLNEAKKFKLCGDWYFYINVAMTGKIFYCHKKLNTHRLHKESVTSGVSLEERFKETQAIHRFVLQNANISEDTKKRIRVLESKLAQKWL